MKNIFFFLAAFILFSDSFDIKAVSMEKIEKPESELLAEIVESEPLTIYDIASAITGAPAEILQGFHFAESSYGLNVNHPNQFDRGEFGLHETEAIHTERAKKWGEYNPDCPLQSAIIAGYIYMEHLEVLGNQEDAIAAYKQGRTGLKRDGRADWYVKRVLNCPERILYGYV